ncbi:hypothetical protein CJF31_00011087 [Rutstroemia sp. NJR-2017a BVV2]|nr:hypothetical protein CJF31_00011087 [Rutstroemia sp. NJR-2017a BVV2]
MSSTVILAGSIAAGLIVGMIFGAMLTFGCVDAPFAAIVQRTILFELLQTPADKRSERVLDLCFFQLSDSTPYNYIHQFLTDEVIDHLEAKINDPAPVPMPSPREFSVIQRLSPRNCKLDYSIPSVAQPMGFDKELITFMQRIRDHKKKTANQDRNVDTCGERSDSAFDYDDELSARKASKELGDVEKGLGSLQSS